MKKNQNNKNNQNKKNNKIKNNIVTDTNLKISELNTDIKTNIKLIIIVGIIGFGFFIFGKKNMENVQNISRICDKNNIEYQTHTNWFGNATKIYVKE